MTSPISPRVSERETVVNRLAVPTARIFAATVILVTGAGVSAVFWKMPTANELHALYHEGVVDQELAAAPLPNESVPNISLEEMQQMSLPMLDFAPAPVADDGASQYAQVYPAPAPLVAAVNAVHGRDISQEIEETFTPVTPQKFEPVRQVIDEKPISVEPVNRDFPPMPTSVSTTERSDELLTAFHFVENSKAGLDNSPEQPTDPFPVATAAVPALQPLQPIQLDGLAPLLPLQEIDMTPFSVLAAE